MFLERTSSKTFCPRGHFVVKPFGSVKKINMETMTDCRIPLPYIAMVWLVAGRATSVEWHSTGAFTYPI